MSFLCNRNSLNFDSCQFQKEYGSDSGSVLFEGQFIQSEAISVRNSKEIFGW